MTERPNRQVLADMFDGKADAWQRNALDNVEEWGFQDVETVLLAIQEELGEVTQAHLEAMDEDGDPARIQEEIDDLAPLVFQLQWALDEADHDYEQPV